jgi:hypothetical protein
MSVLETPTREFKPRTPGWTAEALDDPEIERRWRAGRFEIIGGVLTEMPAAYFSGSASRFRLLFITNTHFERTAYRGAFAPQAEIIITKTRVTVADAAFLTPEDQAKQAQAVLQHRRTDPERSRIYVPPT